MKKAVTAAQLKAIRTGMGWDLSEAARQTGYSRGQLHNVEKGRYIVTDELMQAFTVAVEKSVAAHQKILQKLKNNA